MSSRKNSEIGLELAVGAFVALVFAALAVFTIVVSGKSLFKKNDFYIEAILPDAMGLRHNDPVIAKGTTVGSVESVFYAADGVHVSAKLSSPVQFREGYSVTVESTSILGGRQLVLDEGPDGGAPVSDVRHLRGSQPSDLMGDAAAAVGKVREYLESDALEEILENVRAITASLRVVGERLENGEGTVGRLLAEDGVYLKLDEILGDVREVTARLERGEGTVGKLLVEEDVYRDLKATIANLQAISERVERGEGTVGKLLSDDDSVYRDLQATVANLRQVSDKVAAGEGTIGRLLVSDDIGDNLDGTLTDARELMDDFREANTLSTFTSLLFSGF